VNYNVILAVSSCLVDECLGCLGPLSAVISQPLNSYAPTTGNTHKGEAKSLVTSLKNCSNYVTLEHSVSATILDTVPVKIANRLMNTRFLS